MTKFSRGKGLKNWHSLCLVGMQIRTIFLEGDLEIFNKSLWKDSYPLCQTDPVSTLSTLPSPRKTAPVDYINRPCFVSWPNPWADEEEGELWAGGELSTYSPGTFPVWPPFPATVCPLKVHFIIPCFCPFGYRAW